MLLQLQAIETEGVDDSLHLGFRNAAPGVALARNDAHFARGVRRHGLPPHTNYSPAPARWQNPIRNPLVWLQTQLEEERGEEKAANDEAHELNELLHAILREDVEELLPARELQAVREEEVAAELLRDRSGR